MTGSTAAGPSVPRARAESDRWFVAVELPCRSSARCPTLAAGERLLVPGVAQLEHARARGMRIAVATRERASYGTDVDWLVDRWVECETRDAAAVVNGLAGLDGPVAAVTSTVDGFLGSAAGAARALGLPGPTPGSPALAEDEAVLRAAVAAAGVAVAPGVVVSATDPALTAAVGYPCVVSPVDGGRRWDVALVSDDRELRAVAARHAGRRTYGRGVEPRRRLLVEQYVHGPRFAADGVVVAGRPVVLAWSEQVMTAPPEWSELATTAVRQPPVRQAPDFVCAVLAAAGLDAGPFHLEFVLGPAGPVFAGLQARPADPGAQLCVDQVSGLDSAALAVAALLGEALPRPEGAPVAACARMHLLCHTGGRVRAISGVREVAAIPGLLVAEAFTDVGDEVEPPGSPEAFLGQVLAAGSSPEQARRRVAYALEGVHVDVEVLQTV
ncbi:ATP-grasp domain-containing protein [Blastococcus sp. TF02-8]|uniref:ATP-grasp domain-containing protein n=1 Tax=Blastococcus sp. TF02-8 TaxID=2250574 RepID=UPI0014127E7F|nr:ATP-grasp domain-containing protein [Blastococcus sp. TF02-8]